MSDLATMLAAYATTYPDETDRLIFADWLEERGDVRGSWLREPHLAALLGPGLADPIPRLVAEVAQEEARRLLVRIGPATIPALLAELARGSWRQRETIFQVLAQLGDSSAELAEWIGRLKSDDPREQRAALVTLAELGERAAPAVSFVLELLRDDRDEVRAAAMATLARLGPVADDALIAANSDVGQHIATRQAWHAALAARGPNSSPSDLLVEDLSEGSLLGESAAGHLRSFGPLALEPILRVGAGFVEQYESHDIFAFLRELPEAEQLLLVAAQDRSRAEGGRCFAVQALVRLNTDRDDLIPPLLRLAADASQRVAREAAAGLGRFGERAASAVPVLLDLLGRADGAILPKVIDALAQLGPDAVAALGIVRPLGNAGDTATGHSARAFVRKFADPGELAATIRQGLSAPEAEVRITAWRWLGAAANLFPDLPELLVAGLAEPEAEVRHVAGRVLTLSRWLPSGTTWPSGIDPVPVLRVLLGAADSEVRWVALSDLSFNRHLIPALLPELLALLAHDPAARVRQGVLYAFHKDYGYSPPLPALHSDEVLAGLRHALQDDDDGVRSEALSALRTLWNPLPPAVVPDLLALARLDQGNASSWALGELAGRDDCPAEAVELLRQRLPRYLTERHFGTFMGLVQAKYTPTEAEIPLLVAGVQRASENELEYAGKLLARVGAVVVPSLVPLLEDGQSHQLRVCVASVFQTLGPAARAALPHLARVVASPELWEARAAAQAIAVIAEPAEVVELLRPCFRHRTGAVREAVLEIASSLGPAARPWLEELLYLTRTDGGTEAILLTLVRSEPELRGRVAELLAEPEPAHSTARNILAGLDVGEQSGD